MKFAELGKYLEKLEGTASRNEMTVILAELFGKVTPEEAGWVAYMTQGKLGPAYKSPDFGIADKQMVKALGEKAEKLFKEEGDLGKVAERLSSDKKSVIKIEEVYKKLWEIAEATGSGSQEKKQQLIRDLMEELDGTSAKYAVKMILGKLRTGFSDMTVLDAISWSIAGDKSLRKKIEGLYNVRADLGEIVERVMKDRGVKGEIEPEIGTPVLMARAERASTAGEIWERNGECALEYKLDGLRIQAHVKNNKVILFSRGLENVTTMYPDIVEGLEKQIKHDCIVEGEMIAVGKNGLFLPFQETAQRKRKYDIAEMSAKIPLKIFLFDVLIKDQRNVMFESNEKRREILDGMVASGDIVKVMSRTIAKKVSDIDSFFELAIREGTEGIIAKKLDGHYQAGARDFNWIKYKKSYDKSALTDTIDAVVMGYDLGQGKRTEFGIGGFLVGVYNPKNEKYVTIAKIGTGLTDEEWRKIKLAVDGSTNLKTIPEEYEVKKEMKCDVWVKPKLVVEILADEITRSPMHSSGLALRFPRLISFREKKPTDATSVKELEKLYDLQRHG